MPSFSNSVKFQITNSFWSSLCSISSVLIFANASCIPIFSLNWSSDCCKIFSNSSFAKYISTWWVCLSWFSHILKKYGVSDVHSEWIDLCCDCDFCASGVLLLVAWWTLMLRDSLMKWGFLETRYLFLVSMEQRYTEICAPLWLVGSLENEVH